MSRSLYLSIPLKCANSHLQCFFIVPLGVRSVEFNEEVLSFGTGEGNVYFYDLRAGQYLSRQRSPPTRDQAKCSLRISKGYLVSINPVLSQCLLASKESSVT